MKIYLASHYSRKAEIAQAAKDLSAIGIKVVSTWWKERILATTSIKQVSESFCRKASKRDKQELNKATHFVLFSVDPDFLFTRGGHCWENGYADARGLVRIIVGPRQHIFHYLPHTHRFDTWERALLWIIRHKSGRK